MDWNIRTDLALETRELYKKAQKLEDEVPGVKTDVEDVAEGFTVTEVKIMSEEGANALGKPIGTYYTLEADNLHLGIEEISTKVEDKMALILKSLMNLSPSDTVLVVGLGNEDVTPDSVGPMVVSKIDITRHLIKYVPQYIKEGTRQVSAIIPGVLGTTGIETSDIIKAITDEIKPSTVIVIDALAARNIKRIKNTIQISDTGIAPGSGVGNNRQRIDKKLLGVPVIAVGVPTVVDSKTIVSDVIEGIIEKENVSGDTREEYYNFIENMLPGIENNSMVTPNEIDEVVANISEIIASGINLALN